MSDFDAFDLGSVRQWRNGFDLPPGILETVGHWVGFDRFSVVLQLLWPTFVEVRDCVLLPWEHSPESFEGWWNELSGNRVRIENTINHLHLWDVFDADGVPSHGLSHLGAILAKAWSAALADQFPARRFVVSFSEEVDDYGPTVQIRSL